MQLEDDAGAVRALESFGLGPDALLGSGGEAWVFALDAKRVMRLSKPGATLAAIELRNSLIEELGRSAHLLPFAISEVLDVRTVEGRIATIETRQPGRVLSEEIDATRGSARADLIGAYLEAAAAVGELRLERPYFGELARSDALRRESFRGYLDAAAARSLAVAGPDFAALDPSRLAAALPEAEAPAFVHLDVFPGNVLAEAGVVTAVLDFGPLSIVGDRRLDPLAAAAYLAPEITPVANEDDWQAAQSWLAERGLADLFEATHRWLACFWAGAVDDARLQAWSRRILGIPSSA